MFAKTTIVPKDAQAKILTGLASKLKARKEPDRPSMLWSDGTKLELPDEILQIILIATQALMQNQGVTVVIRSEWLTTKEAAEMMGCSRQHVVELVETKKLKGTKIGTHRRIKLYDLLGFINSDEEERDKAMADLVAHTEEFGGYDLDTRTGEKSL